MRRVLAGFDLESWDPLAFIHNTAWYQAMLRAGWFRPILPYWERFRLDYVITLLLVVLLVLAIRLLWMRKGAVKDTRRFARRSARLYQRNGELSLAAEAWLRAGKIKRAYRLYLKQDKYHEAAELALKLGRRKEAMEHLVRCGDLIEAARVAEEAGWLERAADLHLQREEPLAAARLLEKQGHHLRAAEAYLQAGFFQKAAAAYFLAGSAERAAEILMRQVAGGVPLLEEDAELFLQAAQYFQKNAKHAEAATMFSAAGKLQEAAEAYLRAGQLEKAARSFESAGSSSRAAEIYAKLGRLEDWQRVKGSVRPEELAELAAVLEREGRYREAAETYLRTGDAQEALRILMDHDPAEAGRILAEQGQLAQAARVYLQAGDAAAAYPLAVQAGERELAATAAEKAGKHLEAAKHLLELGRLEQAATYLQQVAEAHPRYRESCGLLSEVFLSLGEKELALQAARRAVAGMAPRADNLENFYRLARLLEESPDVLEKQKAADIYQTILAIRLDFRDARNRRQALLSEIGSEQKNALQQYQLLGRLGRGGMGEVLVGRVSKFGGFEKKVAIKRIIPDSDKRDIILEALRREMAVASRLENPHVVSLLDVGADEGGIFLVFEYIDGLDLKQIMRRRTGSDPCMEAPLAAYIVSRVCNALEYLHRKVFPERAARGIVHRDVSPSNIMVSFDGMVKLIDFGISLSQLQEEKTHVGVVKGKPRYMSPEQARGKPLDGRTDIYSLGVVFGELLYGRRYSRQEAEMGAAAGKNDTSRRDERPEDRSQSPVPTALDSIVAKATRENPAERFQTAAEMERELNQYLMILPETVGQPELAAFMQANFTAPELEKI